MTRRRAVVFFRRLSAAGNQRLPPAPSAAPDVPFSVQCGAEALRAVAPESWARAASAPPGCPVKWSIPAPDGDGDGDGAWARVRCVPAGRTGFAEIDALYRRVRRPDGSLLPEVGTGYSGIGLQAGMRTARVEASGLLVEPLPCAPEVPPGAEQSFRTVLLEKPRATFAFEIFRSAPSLGYIAVDFENMISTAR